MRKTKIRPLDFGALIIHRELLDNLAEVGYMIRPGWQQCGLGTALQQRMIEYAQSKELRGFKANILVENIKMQQVIKKGAKVQFSRCGHEYEVTSLF